MPKKRTLSAEELNKSLEKSLRTMRGLLQKSRWEKEPGTAATWEIKEGRGRARGSKDASDDEKIQREYANDEEENDLLDMEDTKEDSEFAEEPWQDDDDLTEIGRTEKDHDVREQPRLDRKSKISPKMKSATRRRDDEEEEEEERFGKEKKKKPSKKERKRMKKSKMKKSFDKKEADIAMDASPFLRNMDRKVKKLKKSIRSMNALQREQAKVALASMKLSKSIARQPLPLGSALRKGYGRPVREAYDPGAVLQKSQKLVMKGTISTLDGIKVEEWVNGVRPELPENLKPLFEQSAN